VTRWEATRTGLWKGAKFGYVVFLCIMLPIFVVGVFVFVFGVFLGYSRELADHGIVGVFLAFSGSFLAMLGFGILYGAIPGAIISGISACVRWGRVGNSAAFDNKVFDVCNQAQSEANNE
jgi:hypothetical protein